MKADVLAAAGVGADASALPVCDNDEAPIKVNPLRRSIAANMVNSWHTSPRVTFTYAVDVTSMQELRTKLKDVLQEQGDQTDLQPYSDEGGRPGADRVSGHQRQLCGQYADPS